MNGRGGIALPSLQPWMRQLLGGLFALYVVELILRNAGLGIYALAWRPFGLGFQPWQPLTRFFVQGDDSSAVFNVLLGLLLLYFVLPPLDQLLERRQILHGMVAAAIGGTVVPLALDPLLASPAPTLGWTVLCTSTFVLFGLAMPRGVVQLFFVLPVSGRAIVWGTLAIAGLFFLIDPGLRTAEGLGVWLGAWGWWGWLGPGARRRALLRKSYDIEKQLLKFDVIEGGRDKPQGDQDDQGDEWIH